MRIHCSNDVTETVIRDAASKAQVTLETSSEHGSKSRDHAWEIHLSGNSRRRGNGKDYFAATWDQWGVFLGYIFDADPQARCWAYSWEGDFHFKTMGRFNELERDDVPLDHDHRWQYSGIPYHQSCQKIVDGEICDAWQRWQ